ncbi:HEAT repeat domain-containing protein [Frigoriglobus tundricola]|uniref:Cytochrome c domain-containing protein n=1 Tax=Frigoriglobus tundricola TaxID=2774151 RepID=A0A6M5YL98_9BACT|nr:hypothetical protein [Frigoriglobus tundricola]QJW94066.1 hypothetical protein FTUN_1585 [Frigoriglobus tundricola]
MPRPLRMGRWVAVVLAVGAYGASPRAAGAGDQPADKQEAPRLEAPFKRRKPTTEEELRRQLRDVPEAGFDQQAAGELYAPIVQSLKANPSQNSPPADLGMKALQEKARRDKRPDAALLPWLPGPDNVLAKEEAEQLQNLSLKLRTELRRAATRNRSGAEKLPPALLASDWTKPPAVPTVTQMLQTEPTDVRLLLVDVLARTVGKEAGVALAKRAVFDLSPEVRGRAVRALALRPADEYTRVLYDGFRYPWPAAADHAAEAAAELKRFDMVPELMKLLTEPDPRLPFKVGQGYAVREVVRVNHLCNCVLCHAPSLERDDRVRGPVPSPGERFEPYYSRRSDGLFVRADLTYLRQDFSVVQPVAAPGKWPAEQRYDYLVRTRPLSASEQAEFQKAEAEGTLPKGSPQRGAVLFALNELTGKGNGNAVQDGIDGAWGPESRPRTQQPDPK